MERNSNKNNFSNSTCKSWSSKVLSLLLALSLVLGMAAIGFSASAANDKISLYADVETTPHTWVTFHETQGSEISITEALPATTVWVEVETTDGYDASISMRTADEDFGVITFNSNVAGMGNNGRYSQWGSFTMPSSKPFFKVSEVKTWHMGYVSSHKTGTTVNPYVKAETATAEYDLTTGGAVVVGSGIDNNLKCYSNDNLAAMSGNKVNTRNNTFGLAAGEVVSFQTHVADVNKSFYFAKYDRITQQIVGTLIPIMGTVDSGNTTQTCTFSVPNYDFILIAFDADEIDPFIFSKDGSIANVEYTSLTGSKKAGAGNNNIILTANYVFDAADGYDLKLDLSRADYGIKTHFVTKDTTSYDVWDEEDWTTLQGLCFEGKDIKLTKVDEGHIEAVVTFTINQTWVDPDSAAGAMAVERFKMDDGRFRVKVTAPTTVQAAAPYTITPAITPEGAAEVVPSQSTSWGGDKIQFNIDAKEGYTLVPNSVQVIGDSGKVYTWSYIAKVDKTYGYYEFTMPVENVKIKADFVGEEPPVPSGEYAIDTAYDETKGSVDVQSSSAAGEIVPFGVTANDGVEITKITVLDAEGAEVEYDYDATEGVYYFTMPEADVIVTVKFSGEEPPVPVENGWKQVGSDWYYVKDGKNLTGWQNNIPGWNGWFFFDQDGKMATGWRNNTAGWNGQWFFFGSNGLMRTGWFTNVPGWGNAWFYAAGNGVVQMGGRTPDGYVLNADGSWRG